MAFSARLLLRRSNHLLQSASARATTIRRTAHPHEDLVRLSRRFFAAGSRLFLSLVSSCLSSGLVLSCLVSSRLVSSRLCLVLVSPRLAMSLVWSCVVLACLALSCLVALCLSCLVALLPLYAPLPCKGRILGVPHHLRYCFVLPV
jgi:hypothetical protein